MVWWYFTNIDKTVRSTSHSFEKLSATMARNSESHLISFIEISFIHYNTVVWIRNSVRLQSSQRKKDIFESVMLVLQILEAFLAVKLTDCSLVLSTEIFKFIFCKRKSNLWLKKKKKHIHLPHSLKVYGTENVLHYVNWGHSKPLNWPLFYLLTISILFKKCLSFLDQ